MIVNMRGGNGSGKSYWVGKLMERFPCQKNFLFDSKKPRSYTLTLSNGKTLGLVGSYENACGGCDGIYPYSDIWPRVLELKEETDHVLFEGMSVSSSYGSIGEASEVLGNEIVFAFLNTPLDVCVEHVKARRAARGNQKEFDPYNIIKKWRDVQRSYPVFKTTKKRAVVVLDYKKALAQLLKLVYHGYDPSDVGPEFPSVIPPSPRRVNSLPKPKW